IHRGHNRPPRSADCGATDRRRARAAHRLPREGRRGRARGRSVRRHEVRLADGHLPPGERTTGGAGERQGRRRRNSRSEIAMSEDPPSYEPRLRVFTPTRRSTDKGTRRFRRGAYLLPSMFTLANMFSGYACIVYAMRGELEKAAPLIGLAIIVDMLDGRVARMTGTTSQFGVEFDSLADVISFGVAPAIMAFQWGLHPLGRLGWAAGFVFVAGAAIR